MSVSNIKECAKLGEYYSDPSALQDNLIYMDYQATTPIDSRVIERMMDIAKNNFGNAHSISHAFGWKAKSIIEEARYDVANLIGANSKDIIFTSGATESNNIALKGVCEFNKDSNKKHIITSSIEHKCVLQICKYLSTQGFEVTYIDPQPNGIIDPNSIKEALREDTLLVSIFGVHNEIGTINNIKEIGKIVKDNNSIFHTDIAQAFGKIPIDVEDMKIDLASISGHKIYGPKGIGALYIRSKPKVRLLPLLHGGGQERGLRSGTLPTFLIAGLGEAAKIAKDDWDRDQKHIEKLGKMLHDGISKIPHTHLNGDLNNRYKGNWNFAFAFVEGESLMMSISNIAVSASSACASATLEPSYVLKALKVPTELAHSSIRFGIGRQSTEEEILKVIDSVSKGVQKLRDMSPLWDMHCEGIDISKIEWPEDMH